MRLLQSRALLQCLWSYGSCLTLRRGIPHGNLVGRLLLLPQGHRVHAKRRINNGRMCIVAHRSMVGIGTVLVRRGCLVCMARSRVWRTDGAIWLLGEGIMMPSWAGRSVWRYAVVVVSNMGLVPRLRAILLLLDGGGKEVLGVGRVGVDVLALQRVVINGHVTGGHGSEAEVRALRLRGAAYWLGARCHGRV